MKALLTYSDFDKLELRMGRILAASAPDWSRKLLRFEVDFGVEGKRVIFSGIKEWYSPDDFIGKSFPFLINLEPKQMGPEESQGMMLMADGEDKPIVFSLAGEVKPGTIVR